MIIGHFKTNYAADEGIWNTWPKKTGFIIALVLLALFPFVANDYLLLIAGQISIFIIAVVGVNVLVGYTGLMSLGHGAFFAIGAYSTVVIHQYFPLMPPLITIIIAMVVSGFFGLIFGLPSLRVKGLYLAVATLSANFIILFVIRQEWLSQWTGGHSGITTPNAHVFGTEIVTNLQKYYLVVPIMVILILFAQNLFRTRFGRALIAIRDNDHSAEILGISLFSFKLKSFVISAAYCGAAGTLWAYFFPAILPEDFGLHMSITLLVSLVAGGMGTTLGPIFGTILILIVPEFLKVIAFQISEGDARAQIYFSPIRDIIFGLMIIGFLIFEPKGLVAIWSRFWRFINRWPFAK